MGHGERGRHGDSIGKQSLNRVFPCLPCPTFPSPHRLLHRLFFHRSPRKSRDRRTANREGHAEALKKRGGRWDTENADDTATVLESKTLNRVFPCLPCPTFPSPPPSSPPSF